MDQYKSTQNTSTLAYTVDWGLDVVTVLNFTVSSYAADFVIDSNRRRQNSQYMHHDGDVHDCSVMTVVSSHPRYSWYHFLPRVEVTESPLAGSCIFFLLFMAVLL